VDAALAIAHSSTLRRWKQGNPNPQDYARPDQTPGISILDCLMIMIYGEILPVLPETG